MAIKGGNIISYLELDTGKYTASMQAATAQARQFSLEGATGSDKLQASLGILANAGRLMTAGLTVPILGAGTASTKFAIEFESAFAGVRKTVDATEAEYARLNKAILQMGREIPKAHTELSGYMETAGQLGVPQAQLEKFTRTIADLDVATNLAGEEGASMLAQYANVTGMDLSNIDRLGSVIVDLGNNTATTERDIAEMAQRLSGAASILKLTDAQTMGLAATMSSLGINAEAGGSAMSRIMQRMLQDVRSGGDGLEAYAKAAGTSAEAFSKAFGEDPLSALTMFIDGLSQMNAAGEDIYGTLEELGLKDIRITDTLLRMAGAQGQLEANINRANKAWEENTALTKEAEQRYNTTESRIKRAQNSIREAGISIGNTFLPIIGDAAQGVADLANKFAELDEGTKGSILTGAGIAAGAGPAMLLIKGLIGLLSGPGGLAAAAGLGVAALIGLKTAADQATFEQLKQDFGDIQLSTEEIRDIIAQGFGAPAIDVGPLNDAKDAAKEAYDQFVSLENQLTKDVYLVKMGVKTMTPEEVDKQVGGLVGSAQEYLDREENAARMTITAFFGAGSEDGQTMLSGLDTAMAGLKGQMAAKGKELGDALKSAIADGKIDEAEQKVIDNLRIELAEIAARGALVESQSKRDVLIAKAQKRGLSAESIKQSNEELQKYRDELIKSYEKEYETMLELAANLKNLGGMSQAEYDRSIAAINARYGNISADADMATMDTAWKVYGRQLNEDFARPEISMVRDFLKEWGTNLEMPNMPFEMAQGEQKVREAQKKAQAIMDEMGFLFDTLSSMKEKMGGELPEQYQAMFDMYDQIKKLSEGRWEELIQTEPVDSQNVDGIIEEAEKKSKEGMQKVVDTSREKGEEAGKTAVESSNQAAASTPNTVADTMEEPLDGIPDAYEKAGAGGGGAIVKSANAAAASQEITVDQSMVEPLAGVPAEYGSIGANAVDSLVSSVNAGKGRAFAAGKGLANALESGAKTTLQIASPSRRMMLVGENTVEGAVVGMERKIPDAKKTSDKLGKAMSGGGGGGDSYTQGYQDAVNDGRNYRPLADQKPTGFAPGSRQTSPMFASDPETSSGGNKKSGKSGGSSKKAAEQAKADAWLQQTLARVKKEQEALKKLTKKYDDERKYLLKLSGDWRAYYDKTQADRQVEAIKAKYQKLIDAETRAFNKLSKTMREKNSEAHNKLMDQLKKNMEEEVRLHQENYKLQQRLATDFLSARAQQLQAAYNKKWDAAEERNYQKEIEDLEKRIRQSRSAREKRELTEELDRVKQDYERWQDQQALDLALNGINALKEAVSAGVIGLGDLTGDKNLPASAFTGNLNKVQGASAEELKAALTAISESLKNQTGNHYTIDLTGATVRDNDDIKRIVAEFEAINRSIQRDMMR